MSAPEAIDSDKLMTAAMRLLTENPLFKVGSATIRGNDYRVFENAPPSLADLFAYGAGQGDKPFILFEEEVWTFSKIWSDACRLAHALRDELGVRQGDCVGLAMRNYPEWCVSYMAVISLGAVVAPLNAWWKGEEFRYSLSDCRARVVIADKRRLEYIESFRTELGLKTVGARDSSAHADYRLEELIARSKSDAAPEVAIEPDDDFCIVYTSGSTGNPKGVILTHRGAITTLFSWAFVASALKEARGGVSLFGDNPGILLGIPLFHVTGSHSIFLLSWMVGRRVAMMYRWDPSLAVDLVNRHQLTNFVGVPSQSFEMIDAAGARGMPSLIDIGSGGAKRPPEHVRRLKEKFVNANPSSGYGLSETNALGCVISLDDYAKRPDSTGRPVPPCCDMKIVDEHGDAPTGAIGEVWIRSAANFRGYLNLPEETARALTPDGWFKTGDLGRMDEEGFLYIVDRIKDLIIRGGENISCIEVENRAYEYPGVVEVAAFSVPDPVLGERVGLVVFPKESNLDLQALRDFMADGMAGFKVPERIWMSPQPLPRLGTAKFDKRTIRMVALRHPAAWSA